MKVMSSDAINDIQIPFIPKRLESTNAQTTIARSPRTKEPTDACKAFPVDAKYAMITILTPAKRKPEKYSRKAFTAYSSKSALCPLLNISTRLTDNP